MASSGGSAEDDARRIAADLNRLAVEGPKAMAQLVRRGGSAGLARVKANASGRPGPRAPTGDYRRTMTRRVVTQGDTTTAEIGTNAAQARRLEYGFRGYDSLGRYYDQRPLPHWGPMADWLEGWVDAEMRDLGQVFR